MWNASKCDLCGDCLVKCLYTDYGRDEAVVEIKALMDCKEAGILSKCISCFGCHEYCPTGADPFDLIYEMQEKTGIHPVKWRISSGFLDKFNAPTELIPGDPDKPALVSGTAPIPEGALEGQLFQGMTVAIGGKYYCMFGSLHFGGKRFIEDNAQRFIDEIAGLGKDIIFIQDDCYIMTHVQIKEYGLTVPFKYMSMCEYLCNYLRDHQSSITKLGKKVAYHRNCSSRYAPENEAFIDEIFELVGAERPPRKYEGEAALCCGALMALGGLPEEQAAEVQAKNVNDAIACGADALITYCPLCYRTLQQPASRLGLTEIYITDLCRMALGEKPWPA